MKVKQKITHQDGTVEESEFNIEFRIAEKLKTWVLVPVVDEPMAVKITEAGWKDHNLKTYHVLTEWGAYEETSYSYLNEEQLLERYPEMKGEL
jgi:hypothetical protein